MFEEKWLSPAVEDGTSDVLPGRPGFVVAGWRRARPAVLEVLEYSHSPALVHRRTAGEGTSEAASEQGAAAAAPEPPDAEPVEAPESKSALAWVAASQGLPLEDLVERGAGLGLAIGLVGRLEAGESLASMGGDDQLSVLAGFDKVAGWVAAMQRRVIGTLAAGRDSGRLDDESGPGGSAGSGGSPASGRSGHSDRWIDPVDYTADEVAMVLGCSVRAAQGLVHESLGLVRDLPDTLEALAAGRIRLPAARVIVEHTSGLEGWVRRAVQDRVLDKAADRTPTQTRRAVQRAVLSIDPAGARAREVRARRDRCVSTSSADDGMAHLNLYAPIAQVARAYENLDRHAHRLAGVAGEERGQQALRADLVAAALTGQIFLGDPDDLAAAISGGDLGAVLPTALCEQSGSGAARGAAGSGAAESGAGRPRRRAVRAEVVVTGADTTLAGLDDEPGDLAGYGPVSAETLRELAGQATTVHALSTDPETGQVTDVTVVTPPRPDDGATDQPGPDRPQGDGGDAHDDAASSAWLRQLARAAKEAVRAEQAHSGSSAMGTDAAGMDAREADSAGECAPGDPLGAGEHDPYTPRAALRRLIMARDRRCRFPRCSRWAERCDLDHTIPHPEGRTCEGNLGALCRRHHRLKQTPCWRLQQPRPGLFVWTTPTGYQYTVHPTDPLNPD